MTNNLRNCLVFFILLFSVALNAQENCNNGIDDDGDGLIDLNDPECVCGGNTIIPSIIPNPSFEFYTTCPTMESEAELSQLDYAIPWIQSTNATSDYFNNCGWVAGALIDAGLNDFPDGEAAVGGIYMSGWREYIGTTLLSTMTAGTNYQLTFNVTAVCMDDIGNSTGYNINIMQPVNITLYGCTNGNNLPLPTYAAPSVFDPTWIEIGYVTFTPEQSWHQLTINFTPTVNINAIMLGAPAVLPTSYPVWRSPEQNLCIPYFAYDNLLLNDASMFNVNISQTGSYCGNDLVLLSHIENNSITDPTYQWYKDGVAIVGATDASYNVPTELENIGRYNVKVSTLSSCFISTDEYIDLTVLNTDIDAIATPTCVNTGTITIQTPGDAYSFDSGLTWTTNPVLENLTPGNYYIRIKNDNGCMMYKRVTVPEILSPAPTFTMVQPDCGPNGSITITSVAYEYSFDNGVTWTTDPTATGLLPGNYRVRTRDINGCRSHFAIAVLNTNTFYLPPPERIVTHPSCGVGGTITFTTPAMEYSIDNGLTWSSYPLFENLSAGIYYLKIKNEAGCVSGLLAVGLYHVYLSAPLYSIVKPNCPTENGTGITITINTPAAEYSFDNGVTWTTNPVATNLTANTTYSLKIKNSLGCISITASVNTGNQNILPSAPLYTAIQPIDCTTPLGTITISTPAVQYSFDNGVSWVTNNTQTNLPSGIYNLKIKLSANGCPSYPAVAVIQSPPDAPSPPPIAISQPPSCTNPFGFITVTNIADLYSFDNGLTYSTNPVSPPLSPGIYQVRIKIGLCESSPTIAVVDSLINPNPPTLTLTQPNCNNPNGTITVDTPASEYSFDNGTTWTTDATLNNVVPTTYFIKIKDVIGCVSEATMATLIPFTTIIPSPNATPQAFCIQQNATLADVVVNGIDLKWYDAQIDGTLLPSTTLLGNSVYYVSQTVDGCESDRISVAISLQNTPAPTGLSPQTFCANQNATLNELIVNGSSIQIYDSPINGNLLPTTTLLQDGFTYYLSQTLNGCESVQRLAINVVLIDELPANDYSDLVCDDLNDGDETIDLRVYEEDIIANSTAYTFSYYDSFSGAENELASALVDEQDYLLNLGQNTVYVRVVFNNLCHTVVELNLNLISSPFIDMKDTYYICENGFTTLTANAGFDSYTWSTGETTRAITVTQARTYSVTVTKNHGTVICSSTKTTTVELSNKATIVEIETLDWTSYDNAITVIVDGLGDYEYSLDGIHFQSSNQFFGLPNGEYTVYVNDIKGCGVAEEDVYLLMYPKFFTPNGDSYNDVWGIKFHENEPNLKVHIFDRYGKFIKQLTNREAYWDGTYNGEMLPSTDYWFVVIRENGKEHRGHFSLKR
ncbi:gliding motility-associated-like protein [Flavobacterium arsenatis]|uniref:Gliding motility-associated-like protein n=1 Tax=Flavobacterium arsenatis TaxID=1484332 RepID=A0ABU1TJV9_9FLAO|nr:T9SS type B sorting domain-containing protein [Flavobacterium arsenatis]MDR6966153.1 gliding motility-associated-like protein [Flavobacterium arsenatis]